MKRREKYPSIWKIKSKTKRKLKKIREIMVSEALLENPPSDYDYDDEENGTDDVEEEEDDREFFLRCEKISYKNG